MVFQHRGYGFYTRVSLVLSEVLEEEFVVFDGISLEDHFTQDEVLCCVVQFINQMNKLQPAGRLVQFIVILCMYNMCVNDLLFMIIIISQ